MEAKTLSIDAKSAIFTVLAAVIAVAGAYIGTDIETYLFPRIIAALIAILAGVYVIKLVRSKAFTEVAEPLIDPRLLPALGVIGGYLIALSYLGFYTASGLVFLLLCLLYGKRSLGNTRAFLFKLAIASGFMAVLYVVFWVLLHVYTPTGWLI